MSPHVTTYYWWWHVGNSDETSVAPLSSLLVKVLRGNDFEGEWSVGFLFAESYSCVFIAARSKHRLFGDAVISSMRFLSKRVLDGKVQLRTYPRFFPAPPLCCNDCVPYLYSFTSPALWPHMLIYLDLRLLQHFSGWGPTCEVGMGAASEWFPSHTLCWKVKEMLSGFRLYSPQPCTSNVFNPVSTEGQVCVSLKGNYIFLLSLFKVIIDRVIVCAQEWLILLWKGDIPVGCVNMSKVFFSCWKQQKVKHLVV